MLDVYHQLIGSLPHIRMDNLSQVTRMDTIRNEYIRALRDSAGGTVWRENTRGKTRVVWTCMEKDAEDGVVRKDETGKV